MLHCLLLVGADFLCYFGFWVLLSGFAYVVLFTHYFSCLGWMLCLCLGFSVNCGGLYIAFRLRLLWCSSLVVGFGLGLGLVGLVLLNYNWSEFMVFTALVGFCRPEVCCFVVDWF